MISKVEIENFQSHEKTVMEFDPGVNVLIGKSDRGKSAIFRAINWLISNRPLGDSFRSEWGGDTRVVLFTSEGNKIERLRSIVKNEYILNDQVLKAFGTEVPGEVRNILQIDAFNIQAQMDAPFLLSNTPGEAARLLNKAASIDDIDQTVSGIKNALQKIDNDTKYKERQLEKYQQDIKFYDNLPEIELAIEAVEGLEKEAEGLVRDQAALNRVKKEIERVELKLEEGKDVPVLLDRVIAIEESYQTHQNQVNQYNRIYRINKQIKEIQESLEQTEEVDRILELLVEVDRDFSQLKESQNQLHLLKRAQANLQSIYKSVLRANEKITQLEKDYEKMMPETCPLCGAEMKGGEKSEKSTRRSRREKD
jgi:exonuclease SbcC